MFTRFRATPRRLQVSIVETRRIEGRRLEVEIFIRAPVGPAYRYE